MNTNPLTGRPPVVRPREDQRVIEAWGVRVALLAKAADTGGRYTVIEYVAPPTGVGPDLDRPG